VVSVLLVDDQDLIRVGLRTLLEHEEEFEVAGEAADGLDAVQQALEPKALLDAIRTVVDGGALLAPTVTRTVISEFVSASPRSLTPHPNLDLLTDREREVVSLVAEGLNNEEIGRRLYVSPATARTHVSRAMTKLGARDRAQLVVFAYQSGLA